MRACFIFSLVTGFTTSLAAQSIVETTLTEGLSGSITVPDLPLPAAQNQLLASPSGTLPRNDVIWALRFPDEFNHQRAKIERNKPTTFFPKGTFLPASSLNKSPAKVFVPIVEQRQAVGSPWWVDWPSTDLHNQLRPAKLLNSHENHIYPGNRLKN